jgi:hypothetical protein
MSANPTARIPRASSSEPATARPAAAARCRRQTYVCSRSIAGSSSPATSIASSADSFELPRNSRNIADCQDASRDWV